MTYCIRFFQIAVPRRKKTNRILFTLCRQIKTLIERRDEYNTQRRTQGGIGLGEDPAMQKNLHHTHSSFWGGSRTLVSIKPLPVFGSHRWVT